MVQGEKKIFLIGDSTIESISPEFISKATKLNYTVITMNSTGCYFLPEFNPFNTEGNVRKPPNQLFCDTYKKDYCVSNDGVNIFFVDKKHPSSSGANLISDFIIKEAYLKQNDPINFLTEKINSQIKR